MLLASFILCVLFAGHCVLSHPAESDVSDNSTIIASIQLAKAWVSAHNESIWFQRCTVPNNTTYVSGNEARQILGLLDDCWDNELWVEKRTQLEDKLDEIIQLVVRLSKQELLLIVQEYPGMLRLISDVIQCQKNVGAAQMRMLALWQTHVHDRIIQGSKQSN